MRYIGLDIATVTGWAFFHDGTLIEKGSIHISSQMDLPQRLNYFHIELKNLLTRLQPEYCFIEDVILGISGAKTLAYLGRLNGVAISTAFSILQDRVKLYTPTYWKARSFDGLHGMAKKWEIQLAAIKHFNIPVIGDFSQIQTILQTRDSQLLEKETRLTDLRLAQVRLKQDLNRKRNPISEDDRKIAQIALDSSPDLINNVKREIKNLETAYDKKLMKMSIDIAAQTGMTENICDACGIALCGWKELQNATHQN